MVRRRCFSTARAASHGVLPAWQFFNSLRHFLMFLFWFIPLLIAVIITLWLMYRSIDRDRPE